MVYNLRYIPLMLHSIQMVYNLRFVPFTNRV